MLQKLLLLVRKAYLEVVKVCIKTAMLEHNYMAVKATSYTLKP